MILSPAHAIYHYPTRDDNLLVCDSYLDASYMVAFFYPIMLIVVCTVYAVLTRKIPEAFNESKHIGELLTFFLFFSFRNLNFNLFIQGFTMYTTCVIWLAFVPLYFGTANHVPLRITSMSVTISLSATVTLACLFTPKVNLLIGFMKICIYNKYFRFQLYIILIRPERNVRQSMMPVRHPFNKSAGSGQSMMAAVMVTAATCNQNEKIQKHVPPVVSTISQEDSTQLAGE